MNNPLIGKEFEKLVKNKFNVYNSLFLNLPYPNISHIGMLIPLLHNSCKAGLESEKDPIKILDSFFKIHTSIKSEEEQIDFMFRVIQYVERQIVLYDSVEDAAFTQLLALENNLSIKDYVHLMESKKNGDKLFEKLSFTETSIFKVPMK